MNAQTYKAACGVVACPEGEYVSRADYLAEKERADRAEAQLAAVKGPPRSPDEEPVITHDEAQCASKIMTIITDNLNRTPCEEDAIRELLHDSSLGEAVALEVNACATFQRWRAGDVVFARDHQGMKCSAEGLLVRCAKIVECSPDGHAAGYGFMLRDQLLKHLQELARRYYAGEVAVVDEFLQLYSIGEAQRKAALAAKANASRPAVLYGIRSDGSAWLSVGDPANPPHAASDVELPEWALRQLGARKENYGR